MISRNALAAIIVATAAQPVLAAEPVDWPPPPAVQARMKELQQAIANPASSPEQRDAARRELTRLLKSRAARDEVGKEEAKRPPRAAIEPFPRIVRPAEAPTVHVPAPPVAQVDVTVPPKPVVIPSTGSVAVPAPNVAIDPRTGSVLQQVPNGYIDPKTGQFVPR